MIHLFLEEKAKIRFLCRKVFQEVGPDDKGYVCSRSMENSIIKTLERLRIPATPEEIMHLITQFTKDNPGYINVLQFQFLIQKVFIRAFYPSCADILIDQ